MFRRYRYRRNRPTEDEFEIDDIIMNSTIYDHDKDIILMSVDKPL